jgi:peptide/nickel transport system substrate-binding protein
VFLGAAEPIHGPVTPGNPSWYWPELPGGEYDPARSKTLLAGLGLTDRNGDGMLEDAQGRPVRFTVVLQRGISAVERGASFIRDELAKVGVGIDVVGLDAGAIFQRWGSGDYDVIFHRLLFSDSDPAANLDFWLSSGGEHVWNAGQKKPATDWEQQIDDLMRRQAASPDRNERVRLFREAQRIFSEHVPILNFAAQRLFLATSARLTHATPSRLIPLILWNADTLAAAPPRS